MGLLCQVIQKSSNIGRQRPVWHWGSGSIGISGVWFRTATEIDLPEGPVFELGASRLRLFMGKVGDALQMVSAVAAIANDGVLMKPYVVSEIQMLMATSSGRFLLQPSDGLFPETARSVTKILEGVITDGTGTKAYPGFRVAGKPAQPKNRSRTGAYSATRVVASFAGYVPAEPQLAVVVIDEPQGDTSGGSVAAPVFSRVGEQVLSYLGVPSDAPVTLAMASR